ncbi:MAG: sulfurtransferase, partial [Marmoricola sp.]
MQALPDRPSGCPLVDVDELAALVETGEGTVLDVRYQLGGPSGPEEYAAGHVPGAAYVDLNSVLAAPPGPRGRHPLPDLEVFEAAMRGAGVSDDTPVVVYDDWAGRAAARCWWLLRWAGHTDARVLDGGWSAWTSSGHPASTAPVAPRAGDFTVRPGQLPTLEADDVLA